MDAGTFLEKIDKAKVQPVYVLTGDEAFLKQQVLAGLRRTKAGTTCSRHIAASFLISLSRSVRCSGGSFRPDGTAICRPFQPMRRELRDATPRRKC